MKQIITGSVLVATFLFYFVLMLFAELGGEREVRTLVSWVLP